MIPRLERMTSLRGIAPFEKNVLLTLIGYVIIRYHKSCTVVRNIIYRYIINTLSGHCILCNVIVGLSSV